MINDSPPAGPEPSASNLTGQPLPAHVVPVGLAWAVVVAVGGGMICGLLVQKFGLIGFLSLMVIGVLAGAVSRKISRQAVPLLGWALVVAMMLAMVVSQVYCIRYGIFRLDKEVVESWAEALAKWPALITSPGRRMVNLVVLISAGLGANSAYWRAGKRFRRVIVMEE